MDSLPPNLVVPQIHSVRSLLLDLLRDLYDAERQLIEILPGMIGAARDDELRLILAEQHEEALQHLERLDEVFLALDAAPAGSACRAMRELLAPVAYGALANDIPNEINDIALIAAAHRAAHLKIAGYGSMRSFAEFLDQPGIIELLQESLDEANAADLRLGELSVAIKSATLYDRQAAVGA